MAQESTMSLSSDDHRLIAMHHLGSPLAIYRTKRIYIRLYCWISFIFLLISIGVVLLIIVTQIVFPPVLGIITSVLVTCLLWLVAIPHARYDHIVVCEEGLIYIKKHSAQAIRWEDVRCIFHDWIYSDASLLYMQDNVLKKLILTFTFNDFNELIMYIRQKTSTL